MLARCRSPLNETFLLRRILLRTCWVSLATLSPAATAAAQTPNQARHALIRTHIAPTPLYPAILPNPLTNDWSASFSHTRHTFSIAYKNCCDAYGDLTAFISYRRDPASEVARYLRPCQNVFQTDCAEVQVFRHRVRIGNRHVYGFRGAGTFGYFWKAGAFGYFVEADALSSSVSGCCDPVNFRTLRSFIALLAPVGREWTATTAQGSPVRLYLSRYGLDWYVGWTGSCADGSQSSPTWAEDLTNVKVDGSFHDSFSYNTTAEDSTRLRYTASLTGTLPASTGAPATGAFTAQFIDRDDPTDQAWNCQTSINWQAY